MTIVVVAHDMLHSDGLCDAGHLVQFPRIGPQVGVIDQPLAIAFEMQVIDRIEPYKSGEQAPVCLGDLIARKIAAGAEQGLHLIEGGEQGRDGSVVGPLGRGKT